MLDMEPQNFGPWQTLFDAASKLILRVRRDDLRINCLLRTTILSIIFVHWMEKFHFFGKKPELFCQFCILNVQGKISSNFFSKKDSFLHFWQSAKISLAKFFRRILKISHLRAKRNPWFRKNFVWKKFLSISNLEQNVVEFWSKFFGKHTWTDFYLFSETLRGKDSHLKISALSLFRRIKEKTSLFSGNFSVGFAKLPQSAAKWTSWSRVVVL